MMLTENNVGGENDELFSVAQLQGSYRVQANVDEDYEEAVVAGKQSKRSVVGGEGDNGVMQGVLGNEVSSGNPASVNNQAFTMALGATQPDHSI